MIARRPNNNNQIEEMTEKLSPLGFVPHKTLLGYYTHPHIKGQVFDFSAHSLAGIPLVIFAIGSNVGETKAKKRIKENYKSFLLSAGFDL